MISLFTVIVAAAAYLITFLVARRVFQDHLKLGPPSLLAAAVAGLAFLGLNSHGEGLFAVLLLPYAALAITLLLLFLLVCFTRSGRWLAKRRQTPDEVIRTDSSSVRRTSTDATTPSELADTRPNSTSREKPAKPKLSAPPKRV